jgi:phosphoserine phosphatase RsbU/P
MRILIAEDERSSRKVLSSALSKWGYEVIEAADGNEAWEVLKRPDRPELAIIDWMMPGMSGPELIVRARALEDGENLYLLLLTGMNKQADIVSGLKAGADDYITKPYNRDELRVRLEVGRRIVTLQGALRSRLIELQGALDHIKTLQGIIPICMHCHKIRNDADSWDRVESYIEQHSDATFSHGLCPVCLDKYYPEEEEDEETTPSASEPKVE